MDSFFDQGQGLEIKWALDAFITKRHWIDGFVVFADFEVKMRTLVGD